MNRPIQGGIDPVLQEQSPLGDQVEESPIDIARLLGAVRRQIILIAICCFIGLVCGVAYFLSAQPLYTASVQLLIEDPQANADEEQSSLSVRFDAAKIDSQVVLMKSERIAAFVVRELDLTNDPAFMARKGSFFGGINATFTSLAGFGSQLSVVEELTAQELSALERSAVSKLRQNMSVSRVGLTYVLQISYRSSDPVLAAKISNGFADAYLVDQLEAKYDATRRASAWLQTRIQELREQSLASDLAVQRFRAENDLIAADGMLLGEQQLADVNSQLIVARAETAQAEAKYRRIRDIIDTGQMDAAVTEALNNPVIARLRSDFLEASKRYAEISSKLGDNHVQALKFQSEMSEYQKVIFDELSRIAQSYQSDYAIAQTREASLERSLAVLTGETKGTNETLVTLRDLEREAETYKNLYQNFLERYKETVQQQSFPVNQARVISAANPPRGPSHPNKALTLAVSLVLGGIVGVGFGALREFQDRGFRTGEQVRQRLGLEFLGLLPEVSHSQIGRDVTHGNTETTPNQMELTDTILRQTLDSPLSAFAETLRSSKIAADLMLGDKKPKIIGIVSAYSGEGKSTVSKNFASLLASLGTKTLLMDCDLRNPGLSQGVAPRAEAGLLEVFLDGRSMSSVLVREPDSGLVMVPTVLRQGISHTSEILASPSMKKLLSAASDHFEYIIIDLPPLAPVVDVRAFANQVDAFLMVVEWGKTPRQTVRAAIANDRRLADKCLGILINKVDPKKQKTYEDNYQKEFQNSKYHYQFDE
ncbi:MAG: polysaccharide biosynthesis tyrosine autokinase [Roseibium sp.]|uniref:polysaccharide biosynthesis tyrosine autokinase n=1 Tax=Roseibium sp. TaxID=1936156 RepID=UPI003D9C3965